MTKSQKNFEELDDAVILNADNYINDIEGDKLEETCKDFLRKGVRKFIIDFSATDIINSVGISILIGIIENVRDKKGAILFSGLKKVNHDIFNMVGITKHIPIFKTKEEALNLIDSREG